MGNNTLIKSLRSIYWACHRQNAGVSHSHQSSYLDCSFSIVEMWTKCICDVIKVRQTHEDNPFLTRLVAYNRWKGSLSTMGVCIEKRSCENTARILLQFKERSHPKLNWSHLDLGLPSLQNLKKKKICMSFCYSSQSRKDRTPTLYQTPKEFALKWWKQNYNK